jgi:hypothetical protein
MPAKVIPPGHPVGLAVQLSELEVRAAIKAAGGRWNPEKRLWFLPHGKTLELHLTDRIADWGALE